MLEVLVESLRTRAIAEGMSEADAALVAVLALEVVQASLANGCPPEEALAHVQGLADRLPGYVEQALREVEQGGPV